MNRFAVLTTEFEHLSYPLGSTNAKDKQHFREQQDEFMLHKVCSQTQAEMLVGSSDWLSEHASVPVGFVSNKENELFIVCQSGKRIDPAQASRQERVSACLAVISRLCKMHSQGFGCGGLSPEAMEFSGESAKLLDPSKIFALNENDSLFYEAAATLRALVGNGFAKVSDLDSLAFAYFSASPVCRHAVLSHIDEKKAREEHYKVLSETAKKFLACF